ncbi:MAG: ABC transporter permease [Nitrospirota bacterium]|nr:ABC transporter permease [Nitrospirota bacterium]
MNQLSPSPESFRSSALRRNLMGIYTIWLRDVRRFVRDRPRIIGSLIQPTLFLLILGTGLGTSLGNNGMGAGMGGMSRLLTEHGNSRAAYMAFIFPGILAMTILFTSAFSAISVIWDREVGFLREVLVAPVSRWAVTFGKVLGGATVSLGQGCVMLLLAPVAGVPLTPLMVLTLVPVMFLVAFSTTAMGLAAAARMRSMQGFTVIMNFVVLPIFFLSGAMFPLKGLPTWMTVLVHVDPLTYGVDALRWVTMGVAERPIALDLCVIAGFGLVMGALAVWSFSVRE